jgi:uncharacterized protein (DUF2062 family)
MIRRARGLAGRWLEALLHVDDTPERTAAAFAVGVFFAFSPFLGLHTILGLACAFALNLNRVAVLVGVYTNLPWFIAAYYAFATWVGATLMGGGLPPGFRSGLFELFELSVASRGFWAELGHLIHPLLWPFLVGSTLGALLLAWLAFRASLAIVRVKGRIR